MSSQAPPVTSHRLTVGSIDDTPVRMMLRGQSVDVLYCDPPWTDGHLRVFARKASQSTPKPHVPISWSRFMEALCGLIEDFVGGWVFVEMSTEQAGPAKYWLERVLGEGEVTIHNMVYGAPRRPCALLVGHRESGVGPTWRVPAGAISGGLRQVKAVVGSVSEPGKILFDPCCGFGMSAKAALAHDMVFFGNEIDPAKAAMTRSFLENA